MRGVFRNTRSSIIAAGVVAGIVATLGFLLDQQNSTFYRRELQIRTEHDAALTHARLAANINSNFALLRNLANSLALDPDRQPEDFKPLIEKLFIQNPGLISIAIAPDYVISAIYPTKGTGGRIGKDVRGGETIRVADARNSNRFSARFYGPTSTAGGKQGFVFLYPVVVKTVDGRKLWGAVEAVIDETRFYEATGLLPARNSENQERYPHLSHLSIGVRDLMAPGGAAPPFFGGPALFEQQPVKRKINFAGGAWELAAMPTLGWDAPPANQTMLRILIVLAGCTIIVPVFVSSLLLGERNRNIAKLKAREARLLELSQRLNLALESSAIGIWELRDGTQDLYWDERAATLHGYEADEGWHRQSDWAAVTHPEDQDATRSHFANYTFTGLTYSIQYRVILADGSVRHLRSVGARYEGNGESTRTTGIVWDVTADALRNDTLRLAKETSDIKNAELELALDELSSREHQLEELSSTLDLALDSYQCGIWEAVLGKPGAIWDERMHELYGLEYREQNGGRITGDQWIGQIHPDDRSVAMDTVAGYVKPGDTGTFVCRITQRDGKVHYIRSVGKVHETKGQQLKIIGICFDITEDAVLTAELKTAKQEADLKNIELELTKSRIEHNALHDPLTSLANRRKLDQELDKLSQASQTRRHKFSILHIDLDRFKQINDTLGHAAGDAMLVHAASILRKNIRRGDLVARIGGDEFVILAAGESDMDEMATLADRIIGEMRQPVDFEGFACRCGVSIGIAQASGINIDARKMLINADIALYRAKGMGRNRYEFFTQNLQAEIISSKRTADEILTALERHEFTAWYQPQFDATTLELTGVEALVRWNHPTKGLLTPDRFLKIADELNVVATLDRIVLETALKDKMRWAARGIRVPKVSVNVSSRRLHDSALIDTLKTLQIAPGEISFELVESIFLDESEDVVSTNLEQIKQLGIDIEIDDFGTGHTSIVSLLKLKPKRLKIDRQLVKPILDSPQERALVRSIIDIARSLGVETVAEGVETYAHAELLRQLGCDLLQGYAFAKPLSFDAFCDIAHGGVWLKAS